jgi:fructosamine-3-kinase
VRDRIDSALEHVTEARVVSARPLGGGCVADVSLVRLDDDTRLVAKCDSSGGLAIEAWMLGYLNDRSSLPVPAVLFESDDILLLEYVENDGAGIGDGAQVHAARLLADLHSVHGEAFGLERDTVIGGLHQPNPSSASWREFFVQQRLLLMGGRARDEGALPTGCYERIERLCARIDRWIEEPAHPSLIHGDMWGGNVLASDDHITGFVDPAIYYADPEIELAFSTLFSTFGAAFFDSYRELRPLDPDFFEVRMPIYNLYPLLVHAVLFGPGYGRTVNTTLERFVG